MALPSHEGSPLDVDAVARGLAEMEQAMSERDRYRAALERIASGECMIVRDPDHGVYIDTQKPQQIAKEALSV